MPDTLDLIMCSTCGTQYDTTSESSCKICDDPRQYLPATGQSWTTLRTLQSTNQYHNDFAPDPDHPDSLITIHTSPKVGIGQRAFLCRTAYGNVLWDCLSYIDEDTIRRINGLGGLAAIVISHPHFFGANVHWAEVFGCPVYMAAEDKEWVMRKSERQIFWEGRELGIPLPGKGGGDADADLVTVKTGGHFPGSSVLWFKPLRKLLVADSIAVVPSGVYHKDRVPGTASYTFMWSYPNMIPLPPDAVHNIWKAIKHTEFDDAHGAFVGWETHGDSKKRVLESAKIYVRAMGYLDHAIHQEE